MSAAPIARSSTRQIDPRSHRFGAGVSVIVLVLGFVTSAPFVIPLIGLALAASAFYGTRWSVLGRPWPFVRRALRLGPPAELESEVAPRFAQMLGAIGLALATLLLAVGLPAAAWLIAGVVAGLQLLLAATGYCLGCRLYALRWYAPALFDRIVT